MEPSRLLIAVLLGLSVISYTVAQENINDTNVKGDDCANITNCEDCVNESCHWVACNAFPPSCQQEEGSEMCHVKQCDTPNTTIAPEPEPEPKPEPEPEPEPETTTVPPTEPTDPTTPTTAPTEAPTTQPPTTEAPTTQPPTTEAPTTQPPTEAPTTQPPTEAPTTQPPTEAPTTQPPTEAPTEPPTTTEAPATTTPAPCPPCPSGRHFDASSFFGGMVLAVGIMAVAYAAWRFYRSRNDRNYHTL